MSRVAVYKRGTYPGQIDHPGWLSKVVDGPDAYAEAVADGWQGDMVDAPVAPSQPESEPDAAPKPRGRKVRE